MPLNGVGHQPSAACGYYWQSWRGLELTRLPPPYPNKKMPGYSLCVITFFGYQVLGLVAFIQDDQTVALSVSASQPLHDVEESGAWLNTLCPGIWQVAADTIAGVNILIVHCLERGFLQRRYEQAVGDEHDSLLVDLVNAALGQRRTALQGQGNSQIITMIIIIIITVIVIVIVTIIMITFMLMIV